MPPNKKKTIKPVKKDNWRMLSFVTGISIEERPAGRTYITVAFVNVVTGEVRQFLKSIVDHIGTAKIISLLDSPHYPN